MFDTTGLVYIFFVNHWLNTLLLAVVSITSLPPNAIINLANDFIPFKTTDAAKSEWGRLSGITYQKYKGYCCCFTLYMFKVFRFLCFEFRHRERRYRQVCLSVLPSCVQSCLGFNSFITLSCVCDHLLVSLTPVTWCRGYKYLSHGACSFMVLLLLVVSLWFFLLCLPSFLLCSCLTSVPSLSFGWTGYLSWTEFPWIKLPASDQEPRAAFGFFLLLGSSFLQISAKVRPTKLTCLFKKVYF